MEKRMSLSTADAAAIMGVLAMSSAAMGGGTEPDNDTFPGDALNGTPGGIMIAGDLEDRGCGYGYGYGPSGKELGIGGGYDCGPDTTLGIRDDAGSLTEVDDDGSFLGNGLASAVFGVPVEPSGVVNWIVSGYADFDFDGLDDKTLKPHTELGGWEAYIEYYDADSQYLMADYLGISAFVNPGDTVQTLTNAPIDAASFDLYLDNAIGQCICGDVDYYTVSGLTPDTEYEIRITDADFDSVLGLLDDTGTIIDFNDDDPMAGCCLSVLNGVSDGGGSLRFAVSGYFDEDLNGSHSEFGFYNVAVTAVFPGCNEADLADPFGLHDLADIVAFASAFTSQDPIVDYDDNGLFDLTDITTFITAFLAGCP